MSFAKLIQRFKGGLVSHPEEPRHQPLQLATAAVFLEIAYADGEFTPAEDGDVVGYLRKAFSLSEDSARDLIQTADEIRTRMIDHFAVTNYIRQNTTLADRMEIVKMMWRIGYADGRLTEYENYLVRKIAELLGIEHRAMIDAKVEVAKEKLSGT